MCKHQEGQRDPVTDGKEGSSGPPPLMNLAENEGMVWRDP